MDSMLSGILLGLALALILNLLWRLRRRGRAARVATAPTINSFITSIGNPQFSCFPINVNFSIWPLFYF